MHYIFKLQLLIALVLIVSMPLVKTEKELYQREVAATSNSNVTGQSVNSTAIKATMYPAGSSAPPSTPVVTTAPVVTKTPPHTEAKNGSASRPAVATCAVLSILAIFAVNALA